VRNLVKLPSRAAKSLARRSDPAYALQRTATAAINRMIPAKRRRELDSISGTSTLRGCQLLAYLAGQSPQGGCIVEIGAFSGKSTAWLIEAAQMRPAKPKVHSIDPHTQFSSWHEYQNTVKRFDLENRGLIIHKAYSHEIGATWNKPISFLWIDGGHDLKTVLDDIADFVPHVITGGWVVFDDAAGGRFPGVEQAIAEQMMNRPGFRHAGVIKRFEVFQREA
jgi:predicted O-methyltransferase YrrM